MNSKKQSQIVRLWSGCLLDATEEALEIKRLLKIVLVHRS